MDEVVSAASSDVADSVWVVVPAGGAGTRLWPLSRAHTPKFLLPLTGPRSLLQATLDRLSPIASPDKSIIVCGSNHIEAVGVQLPLIPTANLIGEPVPRGSGSAIGLAAAVIAKRDPGAIMASFAADHDIRELDEFTRAVRVAIEAAKSDYLVTIGLTPTEPATGFGYIERTSEVVVSGAEGIAYRANRFVEKPDRVTAEGFIATGRYAWNASMFIWKVERLLEEMRLHLPDLYNGLEVIAEAWDTPEQSSVFNRVWPLLPDVTIDTGIMEKADLVAVVPASLGWSDVGDWHGLGRLLGSDESSNSGIGERIAHATSGNVVWVTGDKVVALLGVEDLIVVDTDDALMIARRDRAQDVKNIVATLKEKGKSHLT